MTETKTGSTSRDTITATAGVWKFLDDCSRLLESPREYARYIADEFETLFGEPAPPGAGVENVRARVAYQLQILGYAKARVPLPPNIAKRARAAMNGLDLTGNAKLMQAALDLRRGSVKKKKKKTARGDAVGKAASGIIGTTRSKPGSKKSIREARQEIYRAAGGKLRTYTAQEGEDGLGPMIRKVEFYGTPGKDKLRRLLAKHACRTLLDLVARVERGLEP